MYRYRRIQEDVTKKLRDHYYSFEDLVNIVGCGHKTMRRYIEEGIVKPATSGAHSNSQFFTQEQLERANFVYDMQKLAKAPILLSAALFDYMNARRMRFDIQNLLDRIEDYRSNQ